MAPFPMTRMAMRVLMLAPLILLTVALLPSVLLLPLLTHAQGQRVLLFVRQLRGWSSDVLENARTTDRTSAALAR